MFDSDANTTLNDARLHGNFELNNSTLMKQLIASDISGSSTPVFISTNIYSTPRTYSNRPDLNA